MQNNAFVLLFDSSTYRLIDYFPFLVYSLFHKIMRQLILSIVQIVLAVLLVAAILLQQRGSGLGAAFGGGSEVFRTKRGIEKTLLQLTVILAVLFVIVSVVSLKVT